MHFYKGSEKGEAWKKGGFVKSRSVYQSVPFSQLLIMGKSKINSVIIDTFSGEVVDIDVSVLVRGLRNALH